MTKLQGVIVPLVTPLTQTREIDAESLRKTCRRLIDTGVAALFPLGSTGEFSSLTDSEKRLVLETVVDATAGDVPIVAGATETSTKRVVEACKVAADIGANAVAIAPPYYFKLDDSEMLRAFYLDVAEATQLPIIIYDNPGCTKVHILAPLVFELAQHDAFAGIKDSSRDFVNFMKVVRRFHDDPEFSVFLGDERIADAGVIMGANGFVPSMGNLLPEEIVSLYNAASSRDLRQARRIQERILAVTEIYWAGEFTVAGLKYAMSLLNMCEEWVARPALELNDDQKVKVRAILESTGLLS